MRELAAAVVRLLHHQFPIHHHAPKRRNPASRPANDDPISLSRRAQAEVQAGIAGRRVAVAGPGFGDLRAPAGRDAHPRADAEPVGPDPFQSHRQPVVAGG